ncbi:MAG: ATP-dependent DNA ligase, partial [Chloroflexota bacterium]
MSTFDNGQVTLPIQPPLEPMLARLEADIPSGPGWLYEPKWDGFRAIVFRDGEELRIESRDRRSLERYFPELLPALAAALPRTCVVDGEIVITGPSGLDFDALLQRIHPAESRVRLLAVRTPASFVAFDLLALDEDDLRQQPLSERRFRLEGALAAASPDRAPAAADLAAAFHPGTRVMLGPQTTDWATAQRWFNEFEAARLDGVVAKQEGLLYLPG